MSMDNDIKRDERKSLKIFIAIILLLVFIAGGTMAYFTFSTSNNNITGNMGTVDLSLTVTKVLPVSSGDDDLLIAKFSDLATNINNKCKYDDDFANCQIYKITLTNNSSDVNTKVEGSVKFDVSTTPNLSWISIDSYSDTNTYTSDSFGSTFNTASSEFVNFKDNYLLQTGRSVDFYIVVWINENNELQTDTGSYTGTVRFRDSNGKGVTATF